MTTYTYTVAGHAFLVTMPINAALWNYMSNYEPFLDKENDPAHTAFEITVEDGLQIDRADFRPVLANRRKEADIMAMEIYKNDRNDYLIEVKVTQDDTVNAVVLLNYDFSSVRVRLSGSEQTRAFALNRAIMLAYLLAVADKDTMVMHASVILSGGRGYLFMGKSGTGKSTHTALWRKYIAGSELMNDDNPVVRIENNRATVYGSPWSGKTPCYRKVSAPIGGFVRLRQAGENRIRALNPIESYASLSSSGSGMSWEKRTADGKDKVMNALIGQVPCWQLECLPDEAAARLCAGTIRKEASCSIL